MTLLRSPPARLALLAALLAGGSIAVVLIADPSQHDIRRAVDGAGVAAPLAYVGIYVVLTVLLFPGALVTAAGGILFGVASGTALSVLAATVGATVAFAVGRRLGRRQVEAIAGARLGALDRWLDRRGFVAVLYLRLIPVVPFGPLNYAAGLTAVRGRDYVVATAVGIVPGTFAYTALGGSWRHPASPTFLAAVALIVLLAVGGPLVDRRLQRRRAEEPAGRHRTFG